MRPMTCEFWLLIVLVSLWIALFLTEHAHACCRQDKRREDLVAMVQRQHELWPFKEGKRRFTSKTNMAQMRAVLLNPSYGFTKPPVPSSKQVAAQCDLDNTVSVDELITPPPPAQPSSPSPSPTALLPSPSAQALPSTQPTIVETERLAGTELECGAETDLGSYAPPGWSPSQAIIHC